MIAEKYHRRIKGRIEDLVDEIGRMVTYEEVRAEFNVRGFPRPFKRVVIDVLEEMSKRVAPKTLDRRTPEGT